MTPCLPPSPPPPSHAASTTLQDDIEDDCVPAGAGEIHVGCSVRLRAPGLEGDGCVTLRTDLPPNRCLRPPLAHLCQRCRGRPRHVHDSPCRHVCETPCRHVNDTRDRDAGTSRRSQAGAVGAGQRRGVGRRRVSRRGAVHTRRPEQQGVGVALPRWPDVQGVKSARHWMHVFGIQVRLGRTRLGSHCSRIPCIHAMLRARGVLP